MLDESGSVIEDDMLGIFEDLDLSSPDESELLGDTDDLN